MMQISMSRPASALLRQLLNRAKEEESRILLTGLKSTDWQSLTFSGERHVIGLRVCGPGADKLAALLTEGIEDAEFDIPRHFVADIAVTTREAACDGSVRLTLEALTIEE